MIHAGSILVAGVGNVLRGDDGFGVEAARRLKREPSLDTAVEVIETGIGGIGLVHELYKPRRALVLLDAYRRGGAPGSLYVLEPEVPVLRDLDPHMQRAFLADTHYATPIRALAFAAALGHLPGIVRIVGCEPQDADRFEPGLSPPVERAVEQVVEIVLKLTSEFMRTDAQAAASRPESALPD
jgi:hydrogenase maturation protease